VSKSFREARREIAGGSWLDDPARASLSAAQEKFDSDDRERTPASCERCGGRMEYSGEHRLGGSMFTCQSCGTTITP
jgi:hypothetical protein